MAVARGLTNAEIGVALYVRGDRHDPALRGVAHSLQSG